MLRIQAYIFDVELRKLSINKFINR